MRITPPVRVNTRATLPPMPWELVLRYLAAYGCTLIAIAAAQLVIANSFALLLAGTTLAGIPISLLLRWSGLRFFGYRIRRPFINGAVVLLTTLATLYFLVTNLPGLFVQGAFDTFVVNYSATQSVGLLMQVFLIFAVCRCLAIINDKDAVLCAVPSFSVLLLMIVVHRGPEVVAYFLLWSVTSAVLFALDHRSEARQGVSGFVPSVVPGQDVSLSARSLGTIMGLSLVCSIGLSYTVSSRNPDERGSAESFIVGLASHLTQFALNLPETSINAGPEREIDFTSGPTLPTRTALWEVQAYRYSDNRQVRPDYWRMFTLGYYDGSTWSQASLANLPVPLVPLDHHTWPHRPRLMSIPFPGRFRFGFVHRHTPVKGYDVTREMPDKRRDMAEYGAPREVVRQQITSLISNVGFIPCLPVARAVRVLSESSASQINTRGDGAIDIGVLEPSEVAVVDSEVAGGQTYGDGGAGPPEHLGETPNPDAVLTPEERRIYLQLPSTLPRRVRQLARQWSRGADPRESNYARASRLALRLQSHAVYTLRPPTLPTGWDATDFFLFEARRGYCTYFAGALTVLCRGIGIPARVVSGFVNTDWNSQSGISVLREANAHAWTEVWVPGWGWATLDATPPDNRGDNAPGWWENISDAYGSALSELNRWSHVHRLGALGAVGLVLLALLVISGERTGTTYLLKAWRYSAPLPTHAADDVSRQAIIITYHQLDKALTRRYRQRIPWETPSEWVRAAESALNLSDSEPLHRLTALYLRAKYSPSVLERSDCEQAREALSAVSWRRDSKAGE